MNKFDNAYKSIGEVAKILNLVNKHTGSLNTHTIRFWEKEFKQIKPKIFAGKRRYYDSKVIDILDIYITKLHKENTSNISKLDIFLESTSNVKEFVLT